MIVQNVPLTDLNTRPGLMPVLEQPLLNRLQAAYRTSIPTQEPCDPRLAEVVSYSLDTNGSFLRAQLGFGVMQAVGASEEDSMTFGVAMELFHTASLLIDDMPCMDDASHRRGRVCPHIQFSEADTMLAALALIHHAYDKVFSLLDGCPAETAKAARQHLTQCLGVQGILSGQCADLNFEPSTRTGQKIASIASGKTGTLLNLVLGFPAILYQSSSETVSALERLADHWGISYQILDDFKDVLDPAEKSGKTALRDAELDRPNYVSQCGLTPAWYRLNGELMGAGKSIELLSTQKSFWVALQPLQHRLTQSAEKLMDRVVL